jgi:hypothetical protein
MVMPKVENIYEMEPSDALQVAAQKYEKGLFDEAQSYAEYALGTIWRINGD